MNPEYSVIIPLKNEESNISLLIEELAPVLKSLNHPWELICVDDGSTDRTRSVLESLLADHPNLRLIYFDKNYGQSSAFDAGFKAAKGKFIITLDGDGQNDPADIPKLTALIEECDLVCGTRVNRRDTLSKRLISKAANLVRNWLCSDGVQDTGCSLKVYRKSSLDKIKMYHGLHRFLPALFCIEGFRIKSIPVNHRERVRGKSNYNFLNRSFNTLADLWAVRWMQKRQLRYQINKELP